MNNLNFLKQTTFVFFFFCLFSMNALFAQSTYTPTQKWKHADIGDWMAVDSKGHIYTVNNDGIFLKFDTEGKLLWQKGERLGPNTDTSKDGVFDHAHGIHVDFNDDIYVSCDIKVQKFNSDGKFIKKVSYGASDIAVDKQGNYYLLFDSYGSNQVEKRTPDGKIISKWGSDGTSSSKFDDPKAIALDHNGNVFVTDGRNLGWIYKFDNNGKFITKWGGIGKGDGEFSNTNKMPFNLDIDSKGNVYVVDDGSDRIQKFDNNGKFLAKWKATGDGIAIDNQGYIYSSGHNGIETNAPKKVNKLTTQTIQTINIQLPSLPNTKDTYQLQFKHSNKVVEIDTGEGMEMEGDFEGEGDMEGGFGGSLGVGEEGFEGEVESEFEEGDFVMDALLLQKTADKNNELQYWTFKDMGSGFHEIISPTTTEALELKGEGEEMYPSTGKSGNNPAQLWKLEDAGNGYYRLLNKTANKYLEVPDNDKNEDAILHYGSKSGDNQLVKLIKVQ